MNDSRILSLLGFVTQLLKVIHREVMFTNQIWIRPCPIFKKYRRLLWNLSNYALMVISFCVCVCVYPYIYICMYIMNGGYSIAWGMLEKVIFLENTQIDIFKLRLIEISTNYYMWQYQKLLENEVFKLLFVLEERNNPMKSLSKHELSW